MGCVFCATARMPTRRNLATWEIIDQWVQARDLARDAGAAGDRGRLHGDGRAVPRDYDRASSPRPSCSAAPTAARSPPRRSRSAPSGSSPRSTAYTAEGHKYRLSISLGAATDEKRARLVPVAARWPVAEVMAAARRHALARRDRVMLVLRLHLGRERRRGRRPRPRRADRRHPRAARPDRRDRPDRPVPAARPPRSCRRFRDALTPPRRPAGRSPLLRRGRHPGRLRDAGRGSGGWDDSDSRLTATCGSEGKNLKLWRCRDPETLACIIVARQRRVEASILIQAAQPTGAVYLAGYVVECMLKALNLETQPGHLQGSRLEELKRIGHNLTRLLGTLSAGRWQPSSSERRPCVHPC